MSSERNLIIVILNNLKVSGKIIWNELLVDIIDPIYLQNSYVIVNRERDNFNA